MFRMRDRNLVSDWVPVEFASGYSNQGAWVSALQRQGDRVTLDGIFKRDAGAFVAGTTYSSIFQLPEMFYPRQTFYSAVVSGTTAAHNGMFIVYESGAVEYRHNAGASSYMSFGGITWPAKTMLDY